jgi:Na+-driven multidrug efflux pump
MLSKYSDVSVAAAGIANKIIWLLNITFSIITAGTAILITQRIGLWSYNIN